MEPEPEYLKIKALWERFIASLPPMDENSKFTEESSPENLAAMKELEREHITNVGYLVEYVKRLLAKIEELEG